jgi:hypothetical protein
MSYVILRKIVDATIKSIAWVVVHWNLFLMKNSQKKVQKFEKKFNIN